MGGDRIGKNRYTLEQIVRHLKQSEVLSSRGKWGMIYLF
jgi:hypothetical protein